MTATLQRYQAHCIWCGRDADNAARKTGRCARCGATLLLEPDLDPRWVSAKQEHLGPVVRARKPRRRPLADPVDVSVGRGDVR